jgi:hypothetical protein
VHRREPTAPGLPATFHALKFGGCCGSLAPVTMRLHAGELPRERLLMLPGRPQLTGSWPPHHSWRVFRLMWDSLPPNQAQTVIKHGGATCQLAVGHHLASRRRGYEALEEWPV